MAAPHFCPPETRLDERKWALRQALRGNVGDDAKLQARLLELLLDAPVRMIGAVWPLPGEPDLRPLLETLDAAGFQIALPVVAARDAPLLFRAWRPGEALVPGPFGTLHPAHGPDADPDLLLVPLVAFDRGRHRLGRGGGFYDRTLAARPGVRAIGFAHAAREVPAVPAGPHDVPLDAVVTEREVIA